MALKSLSEPKFEVEILSIRISNFFIRYTEYLQSEGNKSLEVIRNISQKEMWSIYVDWYKQACENQSWGGQVRKHFKVNSNYKNFKYEKEIFLKRLRLYIDENKE